jgi:hypothetical protein
MIDFINTIDPKQTFRLQILTWIKFRVVTHELSFNDELALCETGRLQAVRGTIFPR